MKKLNTLNITTKKKWHKPQLYSLDFNKTKLGNTGPGGDMTTVSFSAS